MLANRSHVRCEFTNTKKLAKKLARIEASSICRQQFANLFADCFSTVHTHKLEFANTSLPTLVCRVKAAEEVHNCPDLWDISSAAYKDTKNKQAKMEQLAEKLGLKGAEEVKKKFNSLRTYYNKELKKVQSSKKSGAGTGELYISGWIYYDALDVFLKRQVLPRKTLSNMNDVDNAEPTDLPQESSKKENQTPSSLVSKRRKSAHEEEDILTCVLNVMKNPPPVPLPNNAIDDNDLFGQVVGSHMKKIPDGRAKEMLKLKIQQLLVEAKFKEDQLVGNRMTSLWPGQFANASICVLPQTLASSSSAESITYTNIGSSDRDLTY